MTCLVFYFVLIEFLTLEADDLCCEFNRKNYFLAHCDSFGYFSNVESMDEIMESNHTNLVYSIILNVTELCKF